MSFGFPHVPDLRQLQRVEQCRAILAECVEEFSAVVGDDDDEVGIAIGRGDWNVRLFRHLANAADTDIVIGGRKAEAGGTEIGAERRHLVAGHDGACSDEIMDSLLAVAKRKSKSTTTHN